MNKFKSWLIHKLGGVYPQEITLQSPCYTKTTAPIQTLKCSLFLDKIPFADYMVKLRLAEMMMERLLEDNLIEFKDESTPLGEQMTAVLRVATPIDKEG